jgi:hypothetical protein
LAHPREQTLKWVYFDERGIASRPLTARMGLDDILLPRAALDAAKR